MSCMDIVDRFSCTSDHILDTFHHLLHGQPVIPNIDDAYGISVQDRFYCTVKPVLDGQ